MEKHLFVQKRLLNNIFKKIYNLKFFVSCEIK